MDLTKLTAEELRSRFVRLPHDWSLGGQSSMQAPPEEWDEIWLRVERLEKCEAAIQMYLLDHAQKQAGIWPTCRCIACDAARAALERE